MLLTFFVDLPPSWVSSPFLLQSLFTNHYWIASLQTSALSSLLRLLSTCFLGDHSHFLGFNFNLADCFHALELNLYFQPVYGREKLEVRSTLLSDLEVTFANKSPNRTQDKGQLLKQGQCRGFDEFHNINYHENPNR